MLGTYFYHEILRKTVIGFGTLFNNINIRHKDASGTNFSVMKVPLAYGPMQKFLARIQQQPELEREIAITLPRLSFEMQGIQYDPTRKTGIAQTFLAKGGTTAKKVYMPVPYNVSFELSIMAKLSDDALQILEQIVPFFTPEWTSTVNLIPDLGLKVDIPVVLQGTSIQDLYEGDFEQRRALIYTLDFVLKGYVFGPVHKAGIIKTVKSKIISQDENAVFTQNNHLSVQTSTYTINTAASNTSSNTADAALITSTPGLLANGSPTSNASVSVGIDNIDADDDFGVIHDIEEYFNDST